MIVIINFEGLISLMRISKNKCLNEKFNITHFLRVSKKLIKSNFVFNFLNNKP